MKLLDIINLDTTICLTTEKYLNEELSIKEYNKFLDSLEVILEQENEGMLQKFLSPLSTAAKKLASSIANLSKGLIGRILNLINRALKAIIRFKEKHPFAFKVIVAFITIMVIMLFFGAVNAFAQEPDTFLTRSYPPNLLDTMVGLIDDLNTQGVFDGQLGTSISDAKFLLQDLKDGVIDSGNPSQSAVEIAKEAETYLEFLYDVAKDRDSDYASAAINKLTQALEIGRNTVVKGIQGFTVDAAGKLVGPS
jgi:hypothetical protein